jgi:NAD(P)-dependent dehydrogenase (short-subunit alcohol dehydrogenase family)
MNVPDLFRLDGQVALITGGSRGLGLQMAKALGAMGCRVAITARKADELAQARGELQALGIEVLTLVGDLQQLDTIPALVDDAVSGLGAIDILINNAGTTWGAPAEEHPDEAWHKVMNLNVNAPFFMARAVGRRCMIPRRRGKIINVASVAGLKGGRAVQGRAVQPDLPADRRRPALRAAAQAAGQLLPSAHAVDREFRVISALPAPRCRWPARMRCARTRRSSAACST